MAVIGAGCCREVICILKQHIRISEKWLLYELAAAERLYVFLNSTLGYQKRVCYRRWLL